MQKFIFDGPNKEFVVKSGIQAIDVKVDLYSDWKEELLLNDNLKYLQALDAVGGEQIDPSTKVGLSVFLVNGWKVRPAEENSEVTFSNGNLYTDDQSEVFVSTSGDYNTNWIMDRSNLRDEVDITSSTEFVTTLLNTRIMASGETGNGVTWSNLQVFLLAMACGRIVEQSDGVYKFYAFDDSQELFTLTREVGGSGKEERTKNMIMQT
jgi:hypothetical protein